MNLLAYTKRLAWHLLSIPLRAVHLASMEIPVLVKDWRPHTLLDRGNQYALLILNQPIAFSKEKMAMVWNRAAFRATADGGTNVWHQFSKSAENDLANPIPDLITGDFDSADPNHLSFYKGHGAKVIHTPDQDETDFNKCIRELVKELARKELKVSAVMAVCENTGRLDHILSNLNTLIQGPELLAEVPLYLLTSSSVTWVLGAGRHKIHVDVDQVAGHHCGIIPMGQPAYVTTTGLKWDMVSLRLEFGGLISTCNMFAGLPVVTVETDKPVLFTMTL